ncbi:hypothetical protein [Staphylococcus phage S6]|nr:hypothetical protein [Staphylococcus phage S6]
MEFSKKSFIVTFHATLVAKGVLELEEVSEGNGLKALVEEILNEIAFNEENSNNGDWVTDPSYDPANDFRGSQTWYTSGTHNSSEELVEEIDPIDEEHMVEDSVEDSEVQGVGRATEVDPQEEDPENPSTAQGGSLPNQ